MSELATKIITHRGIDADGRHSFPESSREAFAAFLQEGFGLEFDIRFTQDGKAVISHDSDLSRLTNGECTIPIDEMTEQEFLSVPLLNGAHTLSLPELLTLIRQFGSKAALHALHLKHHNQSNEQLELLLPYLSALPFANFIIFDVKIETAKLLKRAFPEINLAPSVAHPHDIARYNDAVGRTLIDLDTAIAHRTLFSWVWLDEWDRKDADGVVKKLYTNEAFNRARNAGLKVAIVSPELHGTSPKLLGGESHEDAKTPESLRARFSEILSLDADAVCTDHPQDILKRT